MTKTKLEQLAEKRDQINNQIKALKAKEQSQKRKEDTRRKVLIGGVVMKLVKEGKIEESQLKAWLNENLKKNDRELFALD